MEIQALNITFLAKKDHQTNIEKKMEYELLPLFLQYIYISIIIQIMEWNGKMAIQP